MMFTKLPIKKLAFWLAVLLISGCTTVRPWERDVMARRSMALDEQPMIASFDDHMYFSKEASSGGKSFDGGGCGCN
jgi:Domain of unknown function (DUF4266)